MGSTLILQELSLVSPTVIHFPPSISSDAYSCCVCQPNRHSSLYALSWVEETLLVTLLYPGIVRTAIGQVEINLPHKLWHFPLLKNDLRMFFCERRLVKPPPPLRWFPVLAWVQAVLGTSMSPLFDLSPLHTNKKTNNYFSPSHIFRMDSLSESWKQLRMMAWLEIFNYIFRFFYFYFRKRIKKIGKNMCYF